MDIELKPYRKRKLTPYQVTVLQGMIVGKTDRQIHEEYGISLSTISNAKKSLIKNGYYKEDGKEKINEDKKENELSPTQKKVLEKIREGKSKNQIAKECGITYYTVQNTIKGLIARGLIIPKDIATEEQLRKLTPLQKKVLNAVKDGKNTRSQIATECKVGYSSVVTAVRSLIEKGLIEEGAVILERDKNRLSTIQEKILEGVKSGMTRRQIATFYKIDSTEVNNEVNRLIEKEIISREDVKTEKKERTEDLTELQKNILRDLEEGLNRTQIAQKYNLKYAEAYKIVILLIKRGLISECDIKKGEGHKEVRKELTVLQKKVLEGIKGGKNLEEIAIECGTKNIGREVYYLLRVGLVREGEIKTGGKKQEPEETTSQEKNIEPENTITTRQGKNKTKSKRQTTSQEKQTEKENIQRSKAQVVSTKNEAKVVSKEDTRASTKIDELRRILREKEQPTTELLQEAKGEIKYPNGALDEYSVNIILRGYSSLGQYQRALGFINECRKIQRDGRVNFELEEKFVLVEEKIRKGIAERNAIRNMKYGASIHDSAMDAGIKESRAVELHKKYVQPKDAPDYEVEF